jgi:hypothetical protein
MLRIIFVIFLRRFVVKVEEDKGGDLLPTICLNPVTSIVFVFL